MVDRQYRCPVCGAPVEGERCEYCGCVIYDFANIDLEHPSYIRLKWGDNYMTMKAIAIDPSITISNDDIYLTNAGGYTVGKITRSRTAEVSLTLSAVMDDGNLFTLTRRTDGKEAH